MSVGEYVRRRALGHVVSTSSQRADPALISELTRIGTRLAKAGNNLNQIARSVNSGAVPLAVSVDPALAENAAALAQLRAVLTKVVGDHGS